MYGKLVNIGDYTVLRCIDGRGYKQLCQSLTLAATTHDPLSFSPSPWGFLMPACLACGRAGAGDTYVEPSSQEAHWLGISTSHTCLISAWEWTNLRAQTESLSTFLLRHLSVGSDRQQGGAATVHLNSTGHWRQSTPFMQELGNWAGIHFVPGPR